MRAWPAILLLLLLPALAFALVGDQLPPAPMTPDPSSIPILGGPTAGLPAVTILLPQATTAGPNVRVSYRQNASITLECLATIDDEDWTAEDPRWSDTRVAKQATVPPNTVRNETFTGVLPGPHVFAVYCLDIDTGEVIDAYRQTVVSGNLTNTSINATLTITSPGATTGPTVTITFRHSAAVSGVCNITVDATRLIAVVAPPSTSTTYLATATTGSHQLRVTCAGTNWSASATTTFRVREGANGTNSTRPPRVRLQGGGATVLANTPFTLLGDRFPSEDLVLLTLTGGSIVDEGEIDAEEDGTFVIEHDGLPAGSYRVTAESFDDPDLQAVLVLTSRAVNSSLPDTDKDSVPDAEDNCPLQKNTDQADADWDGIGDACDATDADGDDDGLADLDDNCPLIYNPSQADEDWNGIGDACDTSLGGLPPDDDDEWVDDGNVDDDIPYPTPLPPVTDQPSDVRWWLWLLPLLVVLLLVGGTVGYLVHEGQLDFTSWDDFRSSVQELLNGPPGKRSATAVLPSATVGATARSPFARQPTPQERATVRGFIAKERQGGIDDLAIRSALLGKGWDKHMVDTVFDELYRERQAPKTAQPATGLPKAPPQK